MDMFEKVEKLKEKANVTFEEAKAALEEANGDLLDAMIILERQGKTQSSKETYSTREEGTTSYEIVDVPNADGKGQKNSNKGRAFTDKIKALWHKSCENYFVVERNNEKVINIPIWAFVLIIIFTWHISLLLMVVGLFFGCRYSFKGEAQMKMANDVMDKAADVADKVKDEFEKL